METILQLSLRNYLLEECFAMVKHLSAEGKEIPTSASAILNFSNLDCSGVQMDEKDVLKLHKELSKKIAPALPKTIWLLYKESQTAKWLNFLGPVKLIRRLMVAAIVSLILFILISCSEMIDVNNISEGIYELNDVPLFIVLSFYLTSASLGATFSALFQANRYIINNTFDPKYEASYWIRYVLGIIIGKQSDQSNDKIANLQTANELEKDNEKQKFVNELLCLKGIVIEGKTSEEINAEIQKKINEISGIN